MGAGGAPLKATESRWFARLTQRTIVTTFGAPNPGESRMTTSQHETASPVRAKQRQRVPRGMWLRGEVYWTRVTAPSGDRKRISLETKDLHDAKRFKAKLEELRDSRANKADRERKPRGD